MNPPVDRRVKLDLGSIWEAPFELPYVEAAIRVAIAQGFAVVGNGVLERIADELRREHQRLVEALRESCQHTSQIGLSGSGMHCQECGKVMP